MPIKKTDDNILHFESVEGVKIDVPFMQRALRVKQIRKINKQYKDDQENLSWALLEAALPAEDLEKVDELFMDDFQKFMAEWSGNDADASLGE